MYIYTRIRTHEIHRVYVHTNFRILLFRCSSCSINRGVLYVYNREGVIIIFFTFSSGKIWKFDNLFVSLQLIWNLEQGAKNKGLIVLAMIIHKPKISLTELHRLYVKKVLLHLVIPRRSGRNSALIVRLLSVYCA